MKEATELHLFVTENDYIIAYDMTDADSILREIVGSETYFGYTWDTFEQWPDDKPFSMVHVDESGRPVESMLPAEWVAKYGRGYLGGC